MAAILSQPQEDNGIQQTPTIGLFNSMKSIWSHDQIYME